MKSSIEKPLEVASSNYEAAGNGIVVGPIPLMLYDEISRDCCIREEKCGRDYGEGFWKRRVLNAEDPRIGFTGTIGIRKHFDTFVFTLWSRTFDDTRSPEELEYEKRKSVVLEIASLTKRAGTWAYGRGHLLTETNTATFRVADARLSEPSLPFAIQFASVIITCASQIACASKKLERTYWEADIDPGRKYTEPDG